MKQRIAVRAIIRSKEKTLLLRRATGRQSILRKYELPGGRLHYSEQPEEALSRYLRDDVGVRAQTIQLFDVLAYIDHDDRDIQYVFILYLVSLSPGQSSIRLSQNYDKYQWKKKSEIQQNEITESAELLMGISQHSSSAEEIVREDASIVVQNVSDASHLIIYSDGGSRGNPGPSSSGFIIMNNREEVIHQGGVYLGITTNNQAEYHGVLLGLQRALELGAKTIDFRLDSLLVVNQLNGVYTIKNRELWPVHERVKELIAQFDKVTFTHVRREFNQLADGMVNKILNDHQEEK